MSDMGFGNVDLGALEGMLAPVNEQFGGTPSPAIPGIEATDFTQQINDAYAPKYANYTPDVGGTAGTGGDAGGGDTGEINTINSKAKGCC